MCRIPRTVIGTITSTGRKEIGSCQHALCVDQTAHGVGLREGLSRGLFNNENEWSNAIPRAREGSVVACMASVLPAAH